MANRNLIVIGGSAGAVTPLKDILSRFASDLPAAVFVVLHVPARGYAEEIGGLARPFWAGNLRLPLRLADDGLEIEPGHVYVGPPDTHLLVDGGRMFLGRGPPENLARPAVDALFRSAALHYGPRAIGVVLSGLLADGAAGLAAIKQCGGIAVVQDPADAASAEMPRRALEATEADFCVVGPAIGELVSRLAREEAGPAVPVPAGLRLEVAIAAGERVDSEMVARIADPAPLTCPGCGGVLSEAKAGPPLRFRCQVGHAYTADVLAGEKDSQVDEALGIALRIIEERAELVRRMAQDARGSKRPGIAQSYERKTDEYRRYADTLRAAMLGSMDRKPAE